MFNIIPFILILLSLSVIITIVVRKFSVLASLDVENMPAEREAKFKEQIVSNRLKRNFFKHYNRVARTVQPAGRATSELFKWLYGRLLEFKDNYNKETQPPAGENKIERLFADVDDRLDREEYDEAEKILIEIIGLDSKSDKAFRELGNLYYERKDFNEAKQSFEHALKLLEQKQTLYGPDAEKSGGAAGDNALVAAICHELALTERATGNDAEALEYVNKALRLEPNNPRYLDIKLEISIINKDKISALDAFEKLQAVNPENQKLPEWERAVGEL